MKRKFHTQAAAMLKQGRHKPGFSLIVTLSLMILLTIVAVGMITLSSTFPRKG